LPYQAEPRLPRRAVLGARCGQPGPRQRWRNQDQKPAAARFAALIGEV
jgi:hypothetical protein